jgi:O-antigen ligase
MVMTSLYLLGLIGILYSPDVKEALNVGGRQLAVFLFPVLLALNSIDLNKYKPSLLKIFGITCIGTTLYLYARAFYTIYNAHLPAKTLLGENFMNHNFSLPIHLHATYLSMYLALAVIIFIYLFQKSNKLLQRILYSICIFILFGGMIQLSSRAALIALLIVNIILPAFLLERKKRIRTITAVTVLSAITLLSIYNIDSFKSRYVRGLENELGIDTLYAEYTEPRVERWQAEMELIRKSPVIGFGSGSEKKLLKKKFLEKKLYVPYARNFNSHSQYLSFLLNMGIIGLVGYLFVLSYSFFFAWKARDIVFLGFLITISMISFSENILFLNKGIFFYSFFLSLFLFTTGKNEYSNA